MFSVWVEGDCFYEDCTQDVEVALLTPGEHRQVFTPTFEPAPDQSSWECESGVRSLPETRVHADVADLAGKRVFVYAKAFWEILCPDYLLSLDDFQIVRASQ